MARNAVTRVTVGRGMLRTALIEVCLVGLTVTACSAPNASEAAIRPFDEVQASEFSFEVDPANPSRAIFRVTTTEPMICAIVWGEDEGLGNLNNSLNMAGTGIVQHDVFLPDAIPGVEYRFVVQGSTADGALYRSEVGTFVIPEVEATAPNTDDRINLALDADVVAVSSEFSASFAAVNAVDGDLGTEWSTADDGDDAWITLDMGEPTEASGFEFLTRSMTDGTPLTETYTVTIDGGEPLGPYPAGSPADPQPSDAPVTGQVFTFEVAASSGGNTGAVEIRILGS